MKESLPNCKAEEDQQKEAVPEGQEQANNDNEGVSCLCGISWGSWLMPSYDSSEQAVSSELQGAMSEYSLDLVDPHMLQVRPVHLVTGPA